MKQVFSTLFLLFFSSLAVLAQTESRIIKVDNINAGSMNVYLEVTSFKVGDNEIFLNEPFTADENWLKNIKVKVKNISDKTMTCVAISFWLFMGINEKLESGMSPEYGLSFSVGDCMILDKKRIDKNFTLKSGEEIELS